VIQAVHGTSYLGKRKNRKGGKKSKNSTEATLWRRDYSDGLFFKNPRKI